MTTDDFKAWRKAMALSQRAAAEALGLSEATIQNYERGYRITDQGRVEIPHPVALACTALYHRLGPWGG